MINRAKLRGKPLDDDCRKARTTTYESGMNDDRVFCYGLYRKLSEVDICNKCLQCNAFVFNAEPTESEGEGCSSK